MSPVHASRTRVALALAALALSVPGAASAATPRASLTDVEDEVMCVACKTPLEVSQSPQADSERAYIRLLISRGETKSQIKNALVAQYGQAVLALPRAHGFNLTVYILPPALVIGGAILLAFTLPKWRRRTRAAAAAAQGASIPALSPTDAHRLDEDLARFD